MITRNITTPGKLVIVTQSGSSPSTTNVIAYSSGRIYLGVTTDITNGNRRSPNPHQYAKETSKYWVGQRTQRQFSPPGAVNSVSVSTGHFGSGVGASLVPNNSAAYDKALSRFYDSLRGSLDLSVDIAQAGQVSKMLRGVVNLKKHLLDINNIKKLQILQERKLPKTSRFSSKQAANYLASKHLEYIYGWSPLVKSIHDTIGQVNGHIPHLRQITETATVKDNGKYKGAVPFGKPDGTENVSARCKISCLFQPSSGAVARASEFTSLNPVSIAWELMPYSFVIDWVYNVGGYLRNLETSLLSQNRFVSGFITKTSKTVVSAKCSVALATPADSDVGSAEAWLVSSSKNRSVLTFAPFPSPPSFKADLGSSRLLAAASLLAVKLRR